MPIAPSKSSTKSSTSRLSFEQPAARVNQDRHDRAEFEDHGRHGFHPLHGRVSRTDLFPDKSESHHRLRATDMRPTPADCIPRDLSRGENVKSDEVQTMERFRGEIRHDV